jgi:hypothetical protein
VGAKRQSLTEFLADNGFGEVGEAPNPQFPEYPPHNAQLQTALAQGARPTDADLALCIDLMRQARQHHQMGNYDQEHQLLSQAHRQFGALAQPSDMQRKILILLLVLAAAGVTWWVWKQSKKKKRRKRLRFQPNESRALAMLDDDEDEDLGEDDDEDDE